MTIQTALKLAKHIYNNEGLQILDAIKKASLETGKSYGDLVEAMDPYSEDPELTVAENESLYGIIRFDAAIERLNNGDSESTIWDQLLEFIST